MLLDHTLQKIYIGSEFSIWNYDESMTIKELTKLGYPYATSCIELDKETFIAVDCGDLAPIEFIEKNQDTKFILDAFKHPRRIKSFLGDVKMFYAKPLSSENFNENQYGRFAIDIFKDGNKLIGNPRPGFSSSMMIDIFVSKLDQQIKKIEKQQHSQNISISLQEKELGSASFQVDFLRSETHYEVKFATDGITFKDLVYIFQNICKKI